MTLIPFLIKIDICITSEINMFVIGSALREEVTDSKGMSFSHIPGDVITTQ